MFYQEDGSVSFFPDLFDGGNYQGGYFFIGFLCEVGQAIQDVEAGILLNEYRPEGGGRRMIL